MAYYDWVIALRQQFNIVCDLYWEEQYEMWQNGYREGGALEDETKAILG